MRGLNRAEICDVNFSELVREWSGHSDAKPSPGEAILDGSALDARGFRELFESQLVIRHLDLMEHVLRVQNKVFYTIVSSGQESSEEHTPEHQTLMSIISSYICLQKKQKQI